MISRSVFTLLVFVSLLATNASASLLRTKKSRFVTIARQSSTTCMNGGDTCRCSKSTSPGAVLCKRHSGNGQCTVDLCDEPFQCDCNGEFMCQQASTTSYWDCDVAGPAAFKDTDTCKCSKRQRTKAAYGLRVFQPLEEYIRGAGDPALGCDLPMDFWA